MVLFVYGPAAGPAVVSIYKEVKGKQGKYLRDLVTVSCKGDPESYHPDPMHIKTWIERTEYPPLGNREGSFVCRKQQARKPAICWYRRRFIPGHE